MGELAALSAHLKNRTVTLYSGNGSVSLHIERRRALTSGDYNTRKAFEVGEHYQQGWARWLPAPDLFATLAEVEQQTELEWITPCRRVQVPQRRAAGRRGRLTVC
jgi:hypothetical protein